MLFLVDADKYKSFITNKLSNIFRVIKSKIVFLNVCRKYSLPHRIR